MEFDASSLDPALADQGVEPAPAPAPPPASSTISTSQSSAPPHANPRRGGRRLSEAQDASASPSTKRRRTNQNASTPGQSQFRADPTALSRAIPAQSPIATPTRPAFNPPSTVPSRHPQVIKPPLHTNSESIVKYLHYRAVTAPKSVTPSLLKLDFRIDENFQMRLEYLDNTERQRIRDHIQEKRITPQKYLGCYIPPTGYPPDSLPGILHYLSKALVQIFESVDGFCYELASHKIAHLAKSSIYMARYVCKQSAEYVSEKLQSNEGGNQKKAEETIAPDNAKQKNGAKDGPSETGEQATEEDGQSQTQSQNSPQEKSPCQGEICVKIEISPQTPPVGPLQIYEILLTYKHCALHRKVRPHRVITAPWRIPWDEAREAEEHKFKEAAAASWNIAQQSAWQQPAMLTHDIATLAAAANSAAYSIANPQSQAMTPEQRLLDSLQQFNQGAGLHEAQSYQAAATSAPITQHHQYDWTQQAHATSPSTSAGFHNHRIPRWSGQWPEGYKPAEPHIPRRQSQSQVQGPQAPIAPMAPISQQPQPQQAAQQQSQEQQQPPQQQEGNDPSWGATLPVANSTGHPIDIHQTHPQTTQLDSAQANIPHNDQVQQDTDSTADQTQDANLQQLINNQLLQNVGTSDPHNDGENENGNTNDAVAVTAPACDDSVLVTKPEDSVPVLVEAAPTNDDENIQLLKISSEATEAVEQAQQIDTEMNDSNDNNPDNSGEQTIAEINENEATVSPIKGKRISAGGTTKNGNTASSSPAKKRRRRKSYY